MSEIISNTDQCHNTYKPMLANRLFKFNLWDIEREQYFRDVLSLENDKINKWATLEKRTSNNVKWLQFTGFTDKKEVEIYEGDICKYHKNTSKWLVSYHFEVRFKNGAFYAYWEREMMGKLEQHWDLLSQKDMRNIRVVSDIFQSAQTTS